MNYWSKRPKNKLAVILCYLIIIPLQLIMSPFLDNDKLATIISITLTGAFVTYIGFYPLERMPRWFRHFLLSDHKEV